MAINLRIPYYTGTSIATTAYVILDISIWQGSIVNFVPAQYSLRKNIIGTSVDVFFEISELIRDYLDINFDGNYTGQNVWVQTYRSAYNSSGVLIPDAISELKIAYDAYSYFEESSFNIDDLPLLISNREIFALEDNIFRVPINTAKNPIVTFYLNNEIISTQSFSSSVESSEQVKYVSSIGEVNYDSFQERVLEDGGVFENSLCLKTFLDSFSIGKVDKIIITDDNGVTVNVIVKTIEECKYEPKKVTFINRFGVLQDMYFFKKLVKKMAVKKEAYNSNIINSLGVYDRNKHTKRDFNITANESITLSSGYLSEEYNEVFKELLLSEKVWVTNIIETGEQVVPINVTTSNITYKTSLNDRLVEYSFDFDNSFNVINNIR
jgi:hypothetical protein